MKQLRYVIVMVVALLPLTLLTSGELETSDNGKLDGFWHLERVDTLQTGNSCDLSGELLFWGVEMKLLSVTDRNYRLHSAFFRFEHSGDILRLYEPRTDDRMNDDPVIDNPSVIAPFGINSLDEKYSVEKLTSGEMVLRTEKLRLVFRKF